MIESMQTDVQMRCRFAAKSGRNRGTGKCEFARNWVHSPLCSRYGNCIPERALVVKWLPGMFFRTFPDTGRGWWFLLRLRRVQWHVIAGVLVDVPCLRVRSGLRCCVERTSRSRIDQPPRTEWLPRKSLATAAQGPIQPTLTGHGDVVVTGSLFCRSSGFSVLGGMRIHFRFPLLGLKQTGSPLPVLAVAKGNGQLLVMLVDSEVQHVWFSCLVNKRWRASPATPYTFRRTILTHPMPLFHRIRVGATIGSEAPGDVTRRSTGASFASLSPAPATLHAPNLKN